MATRIATVFASLRVFVPIIKSILTSISYIFSEIRYVLCCQEFPFVRYRAAKSLDAMTMTTFRDLIPTKLAAGVWNHLVKYKQSIENFPQTETCELLILDRSIDQVS